MNSKSLAVIFVSIFLFSCSNSGQLHTTIKSVEQKNVSSIYVGSKEILVPVLTGFSKVNTQNKRTSQLFGKYLFPNPGEKELAVFEFSSNPNKFIRLVTFKEFSGNNINANDFVQFKSFLVDAQKMLKNFANSSDINKILTQIGKKSGFKVKDIELDNGRFIDTPNVLGLSASHKISIDGEPFVKIEIASAIVLIKGTLLSIQVVNTSGDGNSKWTKDNAKRMAAQVLGLNSGGIKVVKFNPSAIETSKTPLEQYQLGIKYANKPDMKKAKYWIKKVYESNDSTFKEKAEDAWNKYELWKY